MNHEILRSPIPIGQPIRGELTSLPQNLYSGGGSREIVFMAEQGEGLPLESSRPALPQPEAKPTLPAPEGSILQPQPLEGGQPPKARPKASPEILQRLWQQEVEAGKATSGEAKKWAELGIAPMVGRSDEAGGAGAGGEEGEAAGEEPREEERETREELIDRLTGALDERLGRLERLEEERIRREEARDAERARFEEARERRAAERETREEERERRREERDARTDAREEARARREEAVARREEGREAERARGEARPEWSDLINRIKAAEKAGDLAELTQVKEEARQEINRFPISSPERHGAELALIAQDKELSDMFLNRIISIPDATPSKTYVIEDFYVRSTLTTFMDIVKRLNPEEAERHGSVEAMREYFHNMRLALIQGNRGAFGGLSVQINTNHWQEAIGHVGVPTVKRLYDEAYARLGKETLEAEDGAMIDKWVKEEFEVLANPETGVIKNSQYGYTRPLEAWEIQRAMAVGRNFFINKLRGAELAASFEVPTVSAARQFASFDYENAVRLANPIRYLAYRFGFGKESGGQWVLEKVKREIRQENERELREDFGADGPCKIKRLGGVRRESLETSAPMGRIGYETGWRQVLAYLNTQDLLISQEEYREILERYQRLEAVEEEIFGEPLPSEEDLQRDGRIEGDNVRLPVGDYMEVQTKIAGKLGKLRIRQGKRDFLNAKLRPVADQLDFYLGVVLGMDTGEVPLQTKTRIWEKVARLSPARIAYLLSHGENEFPDPGNPAARVNFWRRLGITKDQWQPQESREERGGRPSLEEKLLALQEKRVLEESHLDNRTLLEWHDSLPLEEQTITLENEREVIRRLIQLGQEMAPELAKVKWPDTPFMEDAPFASATYGAMGVEFSRRRISEAMAVSEAGEAILEAFSSPGVQAGETQQEAEARIVRLFRSTFDKLKTVHGERSAQNILYPHVKGFLLLISSYSSARTPLVSALQRALRVPQSVAQEFGGSKSFAFDESRLFNLTENLIGVLRRKPDEGKDVSQLEQMRREIGATWRNVLWDHARTYTPIGILALLQEFFRLITKDMYKEYR